MSSNTQNPPSDAPPSDSQPIPAYKPRKTIKSPALQAKVLAHRAIGTSKEQIAKDLKIDKRTVTSIIELHDFDKEIEQGRVHCVKLIDKGAQAIEKAFDRGDGSLAIRMFEGLGILGENARSAQKPIKLELTSAIGIMFQQKPVSEQPAIEVQSGPEQVSPTGSGPEVQSK